MSTSLLWLVGFMTVLACVPWLLKLWKQRFVPQDAVVGASKFISAVAVGPQQRIVTVEVGPAHARQWLTVGVTPQSIALLSSIPVSSQTDHGA